MSQANEQYERLKELQEQIAQANASKTYAEDVAGLRQMMRTNAARRGYFEAATKEEIRAGMKAYQCLNPDCMAIFFSYEGEIECRACAEQGLQYAVVSGAVNGTPCDERCTNATGSDCECSCGGANHGATWLVGFTFPRNIEAYRTERAERKAKADAIKGVHSRVVNEATLAEVARLAEYFALSLECAVEAEEERIYGMVDRLLEGPSLPVLTTKAGKAKAEQYYELIVTKCVLRPTFQAMGSYSRFVPMEQAITAEDKDGNRFWFHTTDLLGWDKENEEDETRITAGDYLAITARRKGEGDAITFLSHAHIIAWVNPYGFAE